MDNQKLIDLHSKGMSDSQIAKELGYKSSETVRQQRLKLNLPSNGRKSLEKFNREEADKLLELGLSYKEIALKLGVKPITVSCHYLKKNGKLSPEQRKNPSIPLTQVQKEVLFGSLLGDGSLRFNSEKARSVSGKIEHGIKQFDYLKTKKNILKNLTSDIKIINRVDVRFKEEQYQTCEIRFTSNPELDSFHKMFYTNGRSIPEDLSLLTPRALAILFQDDGTRNGNISMMKFNHKDLERFCNYLKTKYNISTSLYSNCSVYIKQESRELFESLIKPYMCKSMYYKLKFL